MFEIRKPLAGYNAGNALVVLDHQTNWGLDLSAYGEPVSGLKVLGGVSLLNSDVGGNDAIGSPHDQANLNLEWDVAQVSGLSFNTRITHAGAQYADAANTQKVPAWNRLDLGVRYTASFRQHDKVTLRANLENAANSNYWASASGYPGAGYLTVGAPRTLWPPRR